MYYNNKTTVYLNGKWLKAKDANVSLYNQTMHYGNGVFEGIRSYKTEDGVQIFKAEEHYERLLKSAELMHIDLNYSVQELCDLSYELLSKNKLENAYIRPLVFLGENMSLQKVDDVNLFICAWEWGKYLGADLLNLCTSSYQRPNPKSCHVAAKTVGHYTNSILATTEAKQRGFDEALLTDQNGFVAEAPGANFFMEKEGELWTPPLGNILPGITRQTILELAKELDFKVLESPFTIEDVYQADAAFLTGTAAEVVGIKALDKKDFAMDWEDSMGYELARLYQYKVTKREYKLFELV